MSGDNLQSPAAQAALFALLLGAVFGLGRGCRWLFDFIVGRLDRRQQRLDHSLENRLKHLEREVEIYRETTMLLLTALAEKDPANPALRDAAQLMRKSFPIAPPDPDLSGLMARADQALKGEEK